VNDGAFVSSEGRGVYGISNVSTAPMASYFDTQDTLTTTSPLAVLYTGDGKALPWSRVRTTIIDTSANVIERGVVTRTDSKGEIFAAVPLAPGSYIIDLAFEGDGSVAVSRAKYRVTVN
jgi:hypothetical protein